MRTTTYTFAIMFMMLLALSFTGCGGHNSEAWRNMDTAESIIEDRPDSSYQILQSIETSSLKGDEEKARYALLMSMALDKNYIDTTDFKVLQPAIDYYLRKGTPDEKLRTYYYQGVIYMNQRDDEKAMESFINGRDLSFAISDSITVGRLLNMQGILYLDQYKFPEFIETSLRAAQIFKGIKKYKEEAISYIKAYNIAILEEDKHLSDSIYDLIKKFNLNHPDYEDISIPQQLKYSIAFDLLDSLKIKLDKYEKYSLSDEMNLDLAYGFSLIGNGLKAQTYYDIATAGESQLDSLKVLSAKAFVYESNGRYKEALAIYRRYSDLLWEKHNKLFTQDLLFAEKKHTIESEKLMEARKKDRVIWISIMVLGLSTIIIGWQNHRHQLLKVRQRLSEQEREKASLENENLRLRIRQLETEREELSTLPESSELPQPVANAIKERIEMLNALLAEKITDNDAYTKPYKKWIDTITSDRDNFMNTTRLAFKASHPKFMEYLESHGLTEAEINYLCLYAIGLRGKEVGEYIQLKRHYNISSEIRRKLGIDEHETNIGIYVRKLLKQL